MILSQLGATATWVSISGALKHFPTNFFINWWWQWISRLWWRLGCKLLWSNPDPNVNSASEFEAGSWVYFAQVVVPPVVDEKDFQMHLPCTCWHIHHVMVPIVNPCETMWILHACLFTIEFTQSTLVSTQTFLLIFTSLWVDCSNNSSFWVSRVIPRVQRIRVFRETVCPIPDASRRPAMS